MVYIDSAKNTLSAISQAALKAQAKIDEARKFKEGNRQNLRDRIVGDEGYKQNNAAYDKRIEDAQAEFATTAQKALEELHKQRVDSFTPRPRDVSPETMQFLSLIDLTQGEAAQLVREAKQKDGNYTLARMVYANANRQGIDMHDDAAGYIGRCEDALTTLAETCASMLEDESGAYAKAFGQVVANAAEDVSKASDAYMNSAGVTSEGVPVEA
ncbi:MAG: hypothetical protein LKI67_05205 [Olsenella sp.]|jgi:hypothetical protein|nr:hypothetical protein [Olsenella sp.]MCI1792452.1 hypothetical protein [Olsenella sp.]MCI1811237.1 hypothetical protein [Olsenella sp.]MCI1879846.1 hypothetical protein [Olsenella sp.]